MKRTRRKAFNFLRSYFDVLNEIEKDKDKLDFLLAVINKQFLDEEPELTGIAKFAYISQQHAIDKSVKGWKDAVNEELTEALQDPPQDPLKGCTQDPPQEEKEQGKEKEELFNLFWGKYPTKVGKDNCKKKFLKLPLTDINNILDNLDAYIRYKPFEEYKHPYPSTFINQRRWEDEEYKQTAKKELPHDVAMICMKVPAMMQKKISEGWTKEEIENIYYKR